MKVFKNRLTLLFLQIHNSSSQNPNRVDEDIRQYSSKSKQAYRANTIIKQRKPFNA